MSNSDNLKDEQTDSYISDVEEKKSFFSSLKNLFSKQKALPPANNEHIKTTMFSVGFLENFNKLKNSFANIGELATKAFSGKKENTPKNTLSATVINSDNTQDKSKSLDDNLKDSNTIDLHEKPIMPKIINKDTIKNAINNPATIINTSSKKDIDSEELSDIKLEEIKIDDIEKTSQKSTISQPNVDNEMSIGDITIATEKDNIKESSDHDDR